MAEAFRRDLAGDRFDVISAGEDPTPIDPEAVDAMRELGIEMSGQTPNAKRPAARPRVLWRTTSRRFDRPSSKRHKCALVRHQPRLMA
jgi:hypothetical protein